MKKKKKQNWERNKVQQLGRVGEWRAVPCEQEEGGLGGEGKEEEEKDEEWEEEEEKEEEEVEEEEEGESKQNTALSLTPTHFKLFTTFSTHSHRMSLY